MPVIPTYQRNQDITGEPAAVRGSVAGSGIVGGAIAGAGQSLARTSERLFQVADEQKRVEDQTKIINLDSDLQQKIPQWQQEMNGKTGADAFDLVNAFVTPTRESYLSEQLKDVNDKALANRITERVNNHFNILYSHAITQTNLEYANQANEALLNNLGVSENNVRNGLTNWQDAYKNYTSLVNDMRNGGLLPDKKMAAAATKKGEAVFYGAYLDNLLHNNAPAFIEIMKTSDAASHLSGDPQLFKQYQNKVSQAEESMSIQNGITEATKIFSDNPEGTLIDHYKEAQNRLGDNPKALKNAQLELKALFDAQKQSIAADAKKAEDAVYSYIDKVQMTGRVARISDVPSSVWADLIAKSPKSVNVIQDQMRREAEHISDRAEKRANRVSDEHKMAILDQIYSDDPPTGREVLSNKNLKYSDARTLAALADSRINVSVRKQTAFVKKQIDADFEAQAFGTGKDAIDAYQKAKSDFYDWASEDHKDDTDGPKTPKEYYEQNIKPIKEKAIADKLKSRNVWFWEKEFWNNGTEKVAPQPSVPKSPSLSEFLQAARLKNPNVSDDELTRYYNGKYGKK